MKATSWLCFIPIFFSIYLRAQVARDYAVPLQAIVSEESGTVELRWSADTSGTGYAVFRKDPRTPDWGTAIAHLPASAYSFTDAHITTGTGYEYYIQRTYADPKLLAHGYIYAGIRKSIEPWQGWLLLLVDANYAIPLRAEIEELKLDLIKEGWGVEERSVSRNANPMEVKSIIQSAAASRSGLQTIYLLGHIPVPYSGGFEASEGNIYPPDGHEDHGGAWPADMYYGTLTESDWTDNMVNTISSVRVQNRNIPGDGKFDRMYTGDDTIVYQIGRVDLTNLPAFALNDTLLTRQYLNKVHAFKMAQTPVNKAGLIDDHFGASDGEAFASSAWNDFTACFGDSVFQKDYVTGLTQSPYLLSYGCGYGDYTICSGVVNTQQFATDTLSPVFTFLFGSYFGDWDSENNLLRAALANPHGGLAAAWSGRPYWRLHPLALGKTIGYCARLTQNNYFDNGTVPHGYAHNSYPTFIHISLMGDPSLRLWMRKPMPPITSISAPDSLTVTISWQQAAGATGYYLSKTTDLQKGFETGIELPAGTTSWTDIHPYYGLTKYLVRPIYLEQTASGTFYNLGLGSIDSSYSINTVGLTETQKQEPLNVSIYPNPASGSFSVETAVQGQANLFMGTGKKVATYVLNIGPNAIRINDLQPGLYILQIECNGHILRRKLIID